MSDSEKKKSKKRTILFSLLIFLIIVLIILVILGIRISFKINDELVIKLTPLDKSLITSYGEEKNITFNFQNYNNFLCKSKCSYEFIDLSKNRVLDNQTLILKSRSNITLSYKLLPQIYGPGQDIYLFEVRCNNIKSFLCSTEEEEQFKSSFITLSYDLGDLDRKNLISLNNEMNEFLYNISELDIKNKRYNFYFYSASKKLNDTIFYYDYLLIKDKIYSTNIKFESLRNESLSFLDLYGDGKYDAVKDVLIKNNPELNYLIGDINNLENEFSAIIASYNYIVSNISDLINLSLLIDPIIEYNSLNNNTILFKMATKYKYDLANIPKAYKNISDSDLNGFNKKIITLTSEIRYLITETNTSLTPNYTTLKEFDIDIALISFPVNVSFASSFVTNISLPKPICCVFGKCNQCCSLEKCKYDPKLYPILFLHGHSFNKKSSPETSLNSFTKMQRNLQNDGVINAGQIDLQNLDYVISGEYGRSGNPVSIRASYYYIYYYDLGGYRITAQRSERIENYALRLNDIIKILKQRTGSDKVNIIAHSMGGLVAREYVRVFGEDSVNKLVLIATPNYGVTGRVKDLCTFFGSEKECEDMSEDSVFMKRLNQYLPSQIKVFSIAGSGCITDTEDGDGIVQVDHVLLPYAQNYIVNGTCTDILKSNLHQDIIDSGKYLASYGIVKGILKQ